MDLVAARTAVDNLALEWAQISALCRSFTDADWAAPTECPGWTVKDQISHLIGTERTMSGKAPSGHKAPPSDHVHNPIGATNEDHVDERRSTPGAVVHAEFDEITAERLLQLRRYGDDDFAVASMTPTGPGTVADFLQLRVMDNWVHEQDIRRALGRAGHLDGPVAEHAIGRFLPAMPMLVAKRAKAPLGSSVRVQLTGPVYRDGTVVVGSERAAWAVDPLPPPTATITMGSEAYVVGSTGRRAGQHLLDAGLITLAGDVALARAVVVAMNVMI